MSDNFEFPSEETNPGFKSGQILVDNSDGIKIFKRFLKIGYGYYTEISDLNMMKQFNEFTKPIYADYYSRNEKHPKRLGLDLYFAECVLLNSKCWGGLTYAYWDAKNFCVGFDTCLRDSTNISMKCVNNVSKYMNEKDCNFYIANCYLLKDELLNYIKRESSKVEGANSKNQSRDLKKIMFKFIKNFHPNISEKDQNLVYSPWSIFIAMSMLTQGTSGEVMKQLIDYFYKPPHQISECMKSMKALATANAIYVNKDHADTLSETYEQLIKEAFEGLIKITPFDSKALEEINKFIELKTKGCIKDLLQTLNPATVLIILNAIHFKEKWEDPFREHNTKIEMFDGKTEVEMMKKHQKKEIYGVHDWKGFKFESCTLPYKAEGFKMIFLKSDNLKKLESVLYEYDFVSRISDEQMKVKLRVLGIPKFKLRTKTGIIGCFQKMGITAPFTPSMDYKKMFSDKAPIPVLSVDNILHEAVIEVDEEGTEAAAATIIALGKCYIRHEFYLDKPFIAVLCFKNLPIFIVKYVKPDPIKRKREIKNEKSKKVKKDPLEFLF
jgi:serpin B